MLSDSALAALQAAVGVADVLVDPDLTAGYCTDWTRRFVGRCDAVVRPGSTAEVSTVMAICSAAGISVVPQGGNTGLVGGGVPVEDDDGPVIVLSTRRLAAIGDVDTMAGQVTVGAGATLAALGDAVAASGWDVGVDLGARDSATIGGMVATNAGGTRVVRNGMMRRNIVGIEAVLASGEVISHLSGLEKDNTGYDLAGLLCGSEGTLAVVTAARMRLVPMLPDRVTVLVACDGWADAVALARDCRVSVEGLEALEALDRSCASLVHEALGISVPFDAPVIALVEWAGEGEPPARLVEVLGDRQHVVATDSRSSAALWEVRDRITESIATTGVPHKLDVTLPLSALDQFVCDVHAACGERADVAAVHVFGHVGDGNLHVNVVGPASDDPTPDRIVLALVARHGGSVSAEHGIGRLKKPYLPLSRSPEEIATFRAIKSALDPHGVLNPGVLL